MPKNNSSFIKILTLSMIFWVMILAVAPSRVFAQEAGAAAPQSIEEARNFAASILKKLPEAVKKVWAEEALPVWQKMWEWFILVWNKTLGPIVDSWRHRFLNFLGKEVEERRPALEQQFQEEREEIQKDLWERFKNLLKESL